MMKWSLSEIHFSSLLIALNLKKVWFSPNLKSPSKLLFFNQMKSSCSSEEAILLNILDQSLVVSDKMLQIPNSKALINFANVFCKDKTNKNKKISKKPQSILQKLIIEKPLAFNCVYNFLNMLPLNERAMRNSVEEESFYRSIFYIKAVEKVELRKNAIVLFLHNFQNFNPQIQYMIDRFKSFGDDTFYRIAAQIQAAYKNFIKTDLGPKLLKNFDNEPLSRYIERMRDQVYMCKVAPNKLVISRRLIELLGEDMELYALELCKFKMPHREIISNQSYIPIITQSIKYIGLLCDLVDERITLQQLQDQANIEFNDYLITRNQNKIFCKFSFHMPSPLISCLQMKELISENDQMNYPMKNDFQKKKLLDLQRQQIRYCEAQSLKELIKLPNSMILSNNQRLAGYQTLSFEDSSS